MQTSEHTVGQGGIFQLPEDQEPMPLGSRSVTRHGRLACRCLYLCTNSTFVSFKSEPSSDCRYGDAQATKKECNG